MDSELIRDLRTAYDCRVAEREQKQKTGWKLAERYAFAERLQTAGAHALLEIGTGTGDDAAFFQARGLRVVGIDLSPAMARACRRKGVAAAAMNFAHLGFPAGAFDAVYALNCLLHVPRRSLPEVLQSIRRVLTPGGLFFLGVYGGIAREDVWPEDHYEPKRLFVFYTDAQIATAVAPWFTLLDFKRIELSEERDSGLHFQRLLLQR